MSDGEKGFQKGRGKTGGRKKGTPNKNQLIVRETLDLHGFNLIEQILVQLPKIDKPYEKAKVLVALVPYVYPRLNQVDVSFAGFVPEGVEARAVVDAPTKKTFPEFCVAAGYPAPYPKQVEMSEFMLNEFEPRCLLGSRGYGKTDYGPVLGVAYSIYLDERDTTLIVSKSRERNAAMLKEIADALKANGVALEKESAQAVRVRGLRGKDHSVAAITIGSSSMRGRHPRRVLFDDAVTEEDVTEAVRKRVQRKWNEAIKLVKNVCAIGQPVHKLDLYARLRKVVKTMEVPHGSIPELDHDLEAQRLAGVSEESIQASYHLKIVSEAGFPFEGIREIEKLPDAPPAIAFIDPSHEGGDLTALTIAKEHFDGLAIHGKAWKKAWNHCLPEMVAELRRHNVKRLAFECNALGDQPVFMLREALADTGCGVVGRKSTTHKHSRIMLAGAYSDRLWLAKTSDKIYSEHVVNYEYGASVDDPPDSLACLLEWIGLIRGK